MSHYIVSFTIGQKESYNSIWNSLKEVIDQISIDVPTDETTSFFAFESNMNTGDVVHKLYYDSQLLSGTDKLLVVNITANEHGYLGIEYPYLMGGALGTRLVKAID
ncbi:hypothetical protein [Vreelandella populi]|uniref:Uncharacterized protein n=1 Tax=Vreelandella populi TaxID=2498858 RepID=A0A433L7N1_9GAMM|nr:hypothetical protein [Halomonas populi]RUR43355.1 hypothetical protein ELY37_16695 [Halomonas populi]